MRHNGVSRSPPLDQARALSPCTHKAEPMIKTIVVDLGNVHFTHGTRRGVEKIYGMVDAPKQTVDELFKSLPGKEGALLRQGKISMNEFKKRLEERLEVSREKADELVEIWHSSYEPNEGMPELMQKLSKNYRLIVFSGTVLERVQYLDKKYDFKKHFNDFVFTFDVGLNKRDKKIFECLLGKVGAAPSECVVVDDTQRILDDAKTFGFNTILYENTGQLMKELEKLGVVI